MPKLRDRYKTAKSILFAGQKRQLAKAIGMPERTLADKAEHIGRLRATELARIVMEQDLDPDAVMTVLRNLSL